MAHSLQQMRAAAFDWIIDLQGLARSALVAWLARGGLTVGLDDLREGAGAFYDVAVPRPGPDSHAVIWYLKVLTLLGVPVYWDFTWLPARPEVAAAVQRRWQPGSTRWVAIHPGARWTSKCWPAEYYAQLLREYAAEDASVRFAILGGQQEQKLGASIAQAAPGRCLDLTGQTSLLEMIEWIRLCELIVTNDSGPMHVAAALDKPVVALFGPTDPRRTGPFRQMHRALRSSLPCQPCFRATCHYAQPLGCLRAIAPHTVVAEVRRRLEEVRQPDSNESRHGALSTDSCARESGA
jgi:lipopolysaccharide heptosyltransferase II